MLVDDTATCYKNQINSTVQSVSRVNFVVHRNVVTVYVVENIIELLPDID